ncbi:hypothetical protein OsJ_14474 [Oryza sativa Japonica Group]|uniref:Uncharacterized protein n=1 Tax=Oryza sativa subsp. japonica TaxID=39947 RepID=B9FER5_ORYSJ|nr:hypothetical protein OsJ_14474 [Oryza sativa Japonica Group]
MASDGDTVAKLAQLSGANLVCHLQTTNRMADYKVAAHVLGERERRAAETEACLQAKIDVLQMKCDLLAKEGAYSEGGKKTNIDSNKNECILQLQLPLSSTVPASTDVSLSDIPIIATVPPPTAILVGPPLLLESDNQERNWNKRSVFSELGSVDQEYVIEEETAPLLPSSMQQPPSMGLISTGGSPIAPALVATSCASVPDMSPHLVEESNKGNIEMQNQLSHLHLNNLMNQLSFDAWMEESGGPFMSEQVPFSLVLPSSSKSASLLSKIETSLWESEENMVIRFMENVELCMGAICALYRQKKLMVESTCEERTKFTSLNESQAYRATQLAEFLLDGDINGPMKKNKEDLVNHDATGPKFIQEYAIQCSKQLFDIYRNKEDLYFC